MLKIKDIRAGMENIRLIGRVVHKSKVIIVNTKFGPAKFAYAIIEDKSGKIRLNLWRNQVDIIKVGDYIEIINAFAKSFKGQVELNVGRSGKIVIKKT